MFHLTIEERLALRNSLQTAEDFDLLDTLEAFDSDNGCFGARTDWSADGCPTEWASARDTFGLAF